MKLLRPLVTAAALIAAALVAPPAAQAVQASAAAGASAADHVCDPADTAACMLPFPNNWFTVADSGTATGRRVNLSPLATPRAVGAVPIDPKEWNRSDGFSPGSAMLTRVPGLDLAKTGAAPITDMARSLAPDAPIALVDAATGERWPYFAELDANASESRRLLLVRPARNFREGHRYLVLLRNLKDASGNAIKPTDAVQRMLSGKTIGGTEKARGDALRRTVSELNGHHVSTDGLYLAWDFTVASTRSLTERAIHMRDDAFGKLGGKAPTFKVDKVTDFTTDQDPYLARRVEGTVDVPSYLDLPGGPAGSSLHYGKNGLPEQLPGNVQKANFRCNVPRSALNEPAQPVMYGHGLLGSASEIDSEKLRKASQDHNILICATDWIGMATGDVPNVASVLLNISRFNTVPDRQQQSYLDFQFLGRDLIHPQGFASSTAFQTPAGKSFIGGGLAYAGASQGGIQGVALTALAKDFTRSALIVPGINYSTMLNRSVDFSEYEQILNISYPDKMEQQLVLNLIQMLWDRGEGDGYAAHVTRDPLPGTPAHKVLVHEAFGDHQVANIATEVMARTMGDVRVRQPAMAPGRKPDVTPFWDLSAVPGYPYDGSSLVIWDAGTPAPPLTNTPNTAGDDPHGSTRGSAEAMSQLAEFLRTGQLIDTCAGAPCTIPPQG
ncbi:hypothetical protein J4573_17955 [Actinomadura barringtoniae]|uniref:ATP-dependent DNA helicase RecG n=1 Tax=Actinomadura barringtoniae TaxID=1427535 RepID=A0A939PA49_9ACTN|nr:hypothetical protein [Actinomadura barringtoniae]MBO2448992.1 hypothetical protein [Actinomadura barringtoniae]